MAVDLDLLPVYNPISMPEDGRLADVWVGALSYLIQNLQGYLSSNGMYIPQVTTDQRNAIQSPTNGQMIYNTTTGTFQGYIVGTWKTFTLT